MREVLGWIIKQTCVHSPVNILPGQGGISGAGDVVDPVVGAESDRVADGKVNAGIPVNDEQDEEHHLRTPKRPQAFFYCAWEICDVGFSLEEGSLLHASCGRSTTPKVMQNDMKERDTGPLSAADKTHSAAIKH